MCLLKMIRQILLKAWVSIEVDAGTTLLGSVTGGDRRTSTLNSMRKCGN